MNTRIWGIPSGMLNSSSAVSAVDFTCKQFQVQTFNVVVYCMQGSCKKFLRMCVCSLLKSHNTHKTRSGQETGRSRRIWMKCKMQGTCNRMLRAIFAFPDIHFLSTVWSATLSCQYLLLCPLDAWCWRRKQGEAAQSQYNSVVNSFNSFLPP